RPHADGTQRNIAAGEALGQRDQVGNDAPVVDCKPAARAAEAAHHFVADHLDPVAVTQLAHALEVAIGRDQDAVGAGYRLEEEAGDRLGPFQPDRLLELAQCRLRLVPAALDALGRVKYIDDFAAVLVRPPPRIAGGLDGAAVGAMVCAVARAALRPATDR